MAAADAAAMLDVSRATLYAYVSRGFVRSQAAAGGRERRYSRDDLDRLRQRRELRRAPDAAAARALHWGLPILESSITLIDGVRLYYRGHDACELARTRPFAEVAALIWTGGFELPAAAPDARPPALASRLPFVPRAQSLLAAAAADDRMAMDLRPARVAQTGVRILRRVAAAALRADPGGAPPSARPDGAIDRALARRWKAGDRAAAVLRAALILCADHELNVSSFTARCVASAGSHPYAAVIAGLSALEGPRHGGASARVESMLQSMHGVRTLGRGVAARVRRGEPIEGFGHPLYRDGDPRGRLLLQLLEEHYRSSGELRFVRGFARAAADATGEHPNIDFALAAVARVLRLPAGAPLMLFAIGRTVGWIGHAIEQYAAGQLIRPRARYVGPVNPAATQSPPGSGARDTESGP
jgi:citrate synthase